MTDRNDNQEPQNAKAQSQEEQALRPEQAAPPEGELARLQADRDDLLARLQRLSADYLNYQKRARRDADESREYANSDLIKSLLPVLDDLERAIEAGTNSHGKDDPLLVGTRLVYEKALETLRRHGLARIDCVGRPFEPGKHSAVMQEVSADVPAHTVLKELHGGYQLKGRTIRPAAVVVSKAPEEAEAHQEGPAQAPPGQEPQQTG